MYLIRMSICNGLTQKEREPLKVSTIKSISHICIFQKGTDINSGTMLLFQPVYQNIQIINRSNRKQTRCTNQANHRNGFIQ